MSEAPIIEVGKTYIVRHNRRGRFKLKVTEIAGEWVTGETVSGKAQYVPRGPDTEGAIITSRISFCDFTEDAP